MTQFMRQSSLPFGTSIPYALSLFLLIPLFYLPIITLSYIAEKRCPSRNPELFDTPCVACGFQGPRCACWALRNGLLREIRQALITKRGRADPRGAFCGGIWLRAKRLFERSLRAPYFGPIARTDRSHSLLSSTSRRTTPL